MYRPTRFVVSPNFKIFYKMFLIDICISPKNHESATFSAKKRGDHKKEEEEEGELGQRGGGELGGEIGKLLKN